MKKLMLVFGLIAGLGSSRLWACSPSQTSQHGTGWDYYQNVSADCTVTQQWFTNVGGNCSQMITWVNNQYQGVFYEGSGCNWEPAGY
jgi:hypothetical protein